MRRLVSIVKGVVYFSDKSFVLGRQSAKGFSEVREGVVGVGFGPDIAKEYG
jgi:hypothetical protein